MMKGRRFLGMMRLLLLQQLRLCISFALGDRILSRLKFDDERPRVLGHDEAAAAAAVVVAAAAMTVAVQLLPL
jgi:hypothetical protein